jgi:hypothetical protein
MLLLAGYFARLAAPAVFVIDLERKFHDALPFSG